MIDYIQSVLDKLLDDAKDQGELINDIRSYLAERSPHKHNPVDDVIWVPIERVQANDYNPNAVAPNEMVLLYTSILHDGYTQPIVTIWDDHLRKYVIVDGFHRYSIMRTRKDIHDLNNGMLPIVVLRKDINDRMASTVRHNRARGKHAVTGMANMVFQMLDKGWDDARICAELGMEADELIRIKHITGFSKLFENTKYRKAWKTKNQILLENSYHEQQTTQASENDASGDQAVLEKPKKKRNGS